MIDDSMTPAQRLERLNPNRWERNLALAFFGLVLILGLMMECKANEGQLYNTILCPTGNSIAMRHDKRDKNGIIIKSHWKRVCLPPLKVHFSKLT